MQAFSQNIYFSLLFLSIPFLGRLASNSLTKSLIYDPEFLFTFIGQVKASCLISLPCNVNAVFVKPNADAGDLRSRCGHTRHVKSMPQ